MLGSKLVLNNYNYIQTFLLSPHNDHDMSRLQHVRTENIFI